MPSGPSIAVVKDYIVRVARALGVPAGIALSVCDFETGGSFSVHLTSPAGARGPFQLMPGTARALGVNIDNWRENVQGGIKYLAQMYLGQGNWHDAYAAYNGGPGNVNGAREQHNASTVLDQARRTYGWGGNPGDPHPNAPLDLSGVGGPRGAGSFNPDAWMNRFSPAEVPYWAMVRVSGGGSSLTRGGFYLRPDVAAAYMAMRHAYHESTGKDLDNFLVSAYRNFQSSSPKAIAYKNSDHAMGGAVDVQAGSEAEQWIRQNGARFGFGHGGAGFTWGDPGHFSFTAGGFQGSLGSYAGPTPADNRWLGMVVHAHRSYTVDPTGRSSRFGGDIHGGNLGGAREAGLENILRGFGLPVHAFSDLIDKAIRNQWSGAQFTSAIYRSQTFQDSFPGIFRPDGSLKMSPAQYLQLGDAYRKTADSFDVKLDRHRIGMLVGNDKSPEELSFLLQVAHEANSSEHFRKLFNSERQAQGLPAVDRGGWFRMGARQGQGRLIDEYEATKLRQQGLQIRPGRALGVARQITPVGQQLDPNTFAKLVADARRNREFVGPELQRAGISDADLALIEAGHDPGGKALQLDRILRNRQALSGAGQGGGSGAIFPSAQEGL